MQKLNLNNHPCFNVEISDTFGRVHLPVAAECNIQCNFCNRKYDCVNENRPGVTSAVLAPEQSVYYLEKVLLRKPDISVAGIAGPGEAFASPQNTLKTLRLIRERFPDILLCVASNGLNILPFVDDLADLQVSHITITVNAVELHIAAKIYSWVRFEKRVLRGIDAANLLITKQLDSIKALKERNIIVKVNTIIIPGINDRHIVEVAKKTAALGADILNCIPLSPSKDTIFEAIEEPSAELTAEVRADAAQYITQMRHCRRCRADAVGMLGEDLTDEFISCVRECSQMPFNPAQVRPCIAVASREGILVNQHLGEAEKFLVYQIIEDGFRLIQTRKAPLPGAGVSRWLELADTLSDCHAVLVGNAGYNPKEILGLKGIKVIETGGLIADVLSSIAKGVKVESLQKKDLSDSGCVGRGGGCG